MSIYYNFYKTSGKLATNTEWHARITEKGLTTSDELCDIIEKSTTLTTTDLKGALSAITRQLINELKKGRRVHIEGLGYFSLKMQGEIDKDKNGGPKLIHPSVRTILFKPEQQILNQFHNAVFRQQQERGKHSAELSKDDIIQKTEKMFEQKKYFTAKQFAKHLQLTISTAYGRLKMLQEQKVIKAINLSHRLVYVKP
jgi:predicted histone-like DNA-binding protein